MSQEDWAKKYAAMDRRLMLKYEQLPEGEQIGKKPEAPKAEAKNPSSFFEALCSPARRVRAIFGCSQRNYASRCRAAAKENAS